MWSQVKQELAQSTARFLTRFIGLLPGIAALIVALLASILLAWILATIVRRLLASMHFDQRLARWGFPSLAEWSPLQSPTLLVAQGIATLVVVAGILIGVAGWKSAAWLVDAECAYWNGGGECGDCAGGEPWRHQRICD